jgi:isoquinoline 1-oxidoreductase beta subunit
MGTTRRTFLQGTSAAVLALGFRLEAAPGREQPPAALAPDLWLRIGRDGRVTVTVGKSEMGQGVRTSLPMIAADELGADWAKVDLVQAEPGKAFKGLGTGGSTSIQEMWGPLRKAAAAAREMLTAAAAGAWGVDPGECVAEDGQVVHPPTGRRSPFGRLVIAASKLPVPKDPVLRTDHPILGHPTRRYDGPRLVDGRAVYGQDMKVPGMLYAAVARCPVSGGKALKWDASAAKARPGVVAVVSVGSGVAVVARSTWEALEAVEALGVIWDEGPHAAFSTEGYRAVLENLAADPGASARTQGDASGALASAGQRLSATYEYPWQAHAPLEPPNAVARVTKDGCELWTGTQEPNEVQDRVARLLGLAPEKVQVHGLLLGGGFGRRLYADYALEAAGISKAVRAPVQVVWNRKDDLAHDHYHPMSVHRLEAGLAHGRISAWTHRVAAPSILLSWMDGKRSPGILPAEVNGAADIPYRIPDLKVEYAEAICPVPLGWWRAIQPVPNVFARECFLDEVAAAAGKDPLRWRLDHLDGDPVLDLGDGKVDLDRLRHVLERAAARAGWGRSLPAGRGLGLACSAFDARTYCAMVAEVAVGPGGAWKVERIVAEVDCGRVVNPLGAHAQVEGAILWGLSALRTQVTFKNGRVEQESYGDLPVWQMSDGAVLDVHLVESSAPPTGLGEPPVPVVAPAVLNALFAATGQRIRRLPLRLA